jgi:hypothetical protein
MYEMEGPRRFNSARAADRSVAGSAEPVTCDVDRADGPVSRNVRCSEEASELVSAARDVRDF